MPTNDGPETQPTPVLGGGYKPNKDFTYSGNNASGGFGGGGAIGVAGTGNLAQGDSGMSEGQKGLLSSQIDKAYGDDTNDLMKGVASSASGLLKDTPNGPDEGFNEALNNANKSSVDQTAESMRTYMSATAPLRQANYEQDAATNLAKVSQLDMNDYMLYNQQQLQQLQLSQARSAAESAYLGSIIGVMGKVVGAGLGSA